MDTFTSTLLVVQNLPDDGKKQILTALVSPITKFNNLNVIPFKNKSFCVLDKLIII